MPKADISCQIQPAIMRTSTRIGRSAVSAYQRHRPTRTSLFAEGPPHVCPAGYTHSLSPIQLARRGSLAL
eukprot:scaffold22634_cov25-Prasinocladus_malaysianus.AAC.1